MEFYIQDERLNDVIIPFGNTLMIGDIKTGKTSLLLRIIMSMIMEYSATELKVMACGNFAEYKIFTESEIIAGEKCYLPQIRVRDINVGYIEDIIDEAYENHKQRIRIIEENGYSSIFPYNVGRPIDEQLPRLAYIIDDPTLPEDLLIRYTKLCEVLRSGEKTGIMFIISTRYAERAMSLFNILPFPNKFVFNMEYALWDKFLKQGTGIEYDKPEDSCFWFDNGEAPPKYIKQIFGNRDWCNTIVRQIIRRSERQGHS